MTKEINQHNLTECVLNETSNQHKVHFVSVAVSELPDYLGRRHVRRTP